MKISLIILILLSFNAFSVESKSAGWLGTFTSKKLTSNYKFWTETQLRYLFDNGAVEQILFRLGPLLDLNNKHQIGVLYAYIQSETLKEHRFTFQHFQNYGNAINFKWLGRSRLEARFLEDSDDDAGRFRYNLSATITNNADYKLSLFNELFVNLTNNIWTGERVFERNRFFIGLVKTVPGSKLMFGYLNQYVPRTQEDVMEHTLTLYIFI